MDKSKNKYLGYLMIALTIFVASPIDDLIIAALFGTVLFGFGTIGFYVLFSSTAILSVIMWKEQAQMKVFLGKFHMKLAKWHHSPKSSHLTTIT